MDEKLSECDLCKFSVKTDRFDVGCKSAKMCADMGSEYTKERRTEGYAMFVYPELLGNECTHFRLKHKIRKAIGV